MERVVFFGLMLVSAAAAVFIVRFLRRQLTVSPRSCAALVGAGVILCAIQAVGAAILAESSLHEPAGTIVGCALVVGILVAVFTPALWILWALIARFRP